MEALLLLVFSPFLSLIAAMWRALWLFLPTMWVLNWTHTVIPAVPALEWWPTFLIIMLIGLLLPVSASGSSD